MIIWAKIMVWGIFILMILSGIPSTRFIGFLLVEIYLTLNNEK